MYWEVQKVMYGLKQSAHLAFNNLVKLLSPHCYFPVQESPGFVLAPEPPHVVYTLR